MIVSNNGKRICSSPGSWSTHSANASRPVAVIEYGLRSRLSRGPASTSPVFAMAASSRYTWL